MKIYVVESYTSKSYTSSWHLLDSLNYIYIYLILNLKYWNITFTYKSLFQGQQLFHCWRHSAVFNREKRWNLCLCKLYSKVLFPWFLPESHYFVVGQTFYQVVLYFIGSPFYSLWYSCSWFCKALLHVLHFTLQKVFIIVVVNELKVEGRGRNCILAG